MSFLRSRGVHAQQVDLALALALFTPEGLHAVRECIAALPPQRRTPPAAVPRNLTDRSDQAGDKNLRRRGDPPPAASPNRELALAAHCGRPMKQRPAARDLEVPARSGLPRHFVPLAIGHRIGLQRVVYKVV